MIGVDGMKLEMHSNEKLKNDIIVYFKKAKQYTKKSDELSYLDQKI